MTYSTPPERATEQCSNCYFCGARNRCLRHPPVIVSLPADRGIQTRFPEITPDCWCGEYKRRER